MTTHFTRPAIVVGLLMTLTACSKNDAPEDAPEPPAAASESAKSAEPPDEAPTAKNGTNGATPNGYIKMSVGGVAPTSAGEAVLLVDTLSNRAIPIFIGGTEALSIQLRLEKREFVRPLTHDLYDATLKRLGGQVESVRVDKLQDNTYYGTVIVKVDRKSDRIELDARPSDAIALAIGNHAPIHVARIVVDQAGIKLDDFRHGRDPVPPPVPPGQKRPDPISL